MLADRKRPRLATPGRGFPRPLWAMLRRSKNRRRRRAGAPVGPVASVAPSRLADPDARRRVLFGLLAGIGVLACGAAVSASVYFLHRFLTESPHFALREIRLPALHHVAGDALRGRTGVRVGENLFAVDLHDVEARLRREPWLADVRVHRELPSAIAVEAVEREAACAVALGPVYLADASGVVFKRATPDEAAAWPLVTGVPRAGYIHDRDTAQGLIREGLHALDLWHKGGRAPVGEVHVDAAAGVTLYTKTGGVAVRIGRGDDRTIEARLARVDAVLHALAATGEHPQVIYADHPHHPERVTVRLATTAPRS